MFKRIFIPAYARSSLFSPLFFSTLSFSRTFSSPITNHQQYERKQVLSKEKEIVAAYRDYMGTLPESPVEAFYNGAMDKIIKHKSWVFINFLDKMITRGYSVFDTVNSREGRFHLLNEHLDRFYRGMDQARMHPPMEREQLIALLRQLTTQLDLTKDIHVRFWASRGGLNDLGTYTQDEIPTYLYAIAAYYKPRKAQKGKAITTTIPQKTKFLAEIKTNNYLLNCLGADEAKKKCSDGIPIFLKEDGYFGESDINGVIFLLEDGYIFSAGKDGILDSRTAERLLDIIEKKLVPQGIVKGIIRGQISAEEIKQKSTEMIVSSCYGILSITDWDEKHFQEGTGNLYKILDELFHKDHLDPEASTPV